MLVPTMEEIKRFPQHQQMDDSDASVVPIFTADAANNTNKPSLCKRGRECSVSSQEESSTQLQNNSIAKKTRSARTTAPQHVPKTFTSCVGSMVVPPLPGAVPQNVVVGLRRQLSSGKIESFLSAGDDAMEVDTEATKPRSMSF